MQEIVSLEALRDELALCPAALVLFGGRRCSVCSVVRPKIDSLCAQAFPLLKTLYVDCDKTPDIPAQFGVLAIPVVVVYFEGRECHRLVRSFGIAELEDVLRRPYELLFD